MSGNSKKHPKQRSRVYQKSDEQRRNGAQRIRRSNLQQKLGRLKKFYGYYIQLTPTIEIGENVFARSENDRTSQLNDAEM